MGRCSNGFRPEHYTWVSVCVLFLVLEFSAQNLRITLLSFTTSTTSKSVLLTDQVMILYDRELGTGQMPWRLAGRFHVIEEKLSRKEWNQQLVVQERYNFARSDTSRRLFGLGKSPDPYVEIPSGNHETNLLSLINSSLAHVGYCITYG
uniref:Uncharacterized protein n=1 Tax=Oryza brachyantha TaxID=4533 RepID=J3LK78_ORYBR